MLLVITRDSAGGWCAALLHPRSMGVLLDGANQTMIVVNFTGILRKGGCMALGPPPPPQRQPPLHTVSCFLYIFFFYILPLLFPLMRSVLFILFRWPFATLSESVGCVSKFVCSCSSCVPPLLGQMCSFALLSRLCV
jgi:hypothetical protein